MNCYYCGGEAKRVSFAARKDGAHRYYRCKECQKITHTIETYIVRGPKRGTPKTGAIARGSRNASSIFTEDDILRLRQMAADGVMQKDIAVIFGIRPSSVSRIVNRHAWTHI